MSIRKQNLQRLLQLTIYYVLITKQLKSLSVKINCIKLQQQKLEHLKILFFTCSFKKLASFQSPQLLRVSAHSFTVNTTALLCEIKGELKSLQIRAVSFAQYSYSSFTDTCAELHQSLLLGGLFSQERSVT